jgi:putative transposase
MYDWFLITLALATGYGLGRWQNRSYRRDRVAMVQRRLQLLALSLELKSLRQKLSPNYSRSKGSASPASVRLIRRRPVLSRLQKWLLAKLQKFWPHVTRFNGFRPATIISWLQKRSQRLHAKKIATGILRGRPPTPDYIVQAILRIKRENPRYAAGHIARMLSSGELKFHITKNTVAKILKTHGFKPKPKGNKPPREHDPGWLPLLHNQFVWAMDFKTVFDIRGTQIFILNIIAHGRRQLIWSRATYYPTAEWVAQQLREAVGWDNPPHTMLLDRDSSFLPVVKNTLPAMGIKPQRIGYKCPWHNAVVERFNRTLQDELLDFVIPFTPDHLNRLLSEYRGYYNTARPHMANDADTPIIPTDRAANDVSFSPVAAILEKRPWLNGLHHSYRWAA